MHCVGAIASFETAGSYIIYIYGIFIYTFNIKITRTHHTHTTSKKSNGQRAPGIELNKSGVTNATGVYIEVLWAL